MKVKEHIEHARYISILIAHIYAVYRREARNLTISNSIVQIKLQRFRSEAYKAANVSRQNSCAPPDRGASDLPLACIMSL